jgi:phasin family protein
MNVLDSIKDKGSSALSSVGQFNEQAIEKLDKSAKLSLSTLSYFSDISFQQLRALSSIRDIESLKKFSSESVSLSGAVTKRLLEDGKAWMSLGAEVKDSVAQSFSRTKEAASDAIGEVSSEIKNEIKQKTSAKAVANPSY